MNFFLEEQGIPLIVEILEVHGKHNLLRYRQLLERLRIKNYIIADIDYMNQVDKENANLFFTTDRSKIDENVIGNKKSKDGKSLTKMLEESIRTKNFDELTDLLNYIKSRYTKIRDNLTESELTKLNNTIHALQQRYIYLLRHGEIEQYLPPGCKDLNKYIKILSKEDFFEEYKRSIPQQPYENIIYIINDIIQKL